LKYDEVSRVVPLYSTTPLFVAIIAAIFLGEVFHIYKYLGIGLLVIGSLLITYKKKLHLGPSFWCIILASMGWGFCVVIIKYLLEFADFWTIFSYLRLGGLITAIPVAIVFYKDLKIGLQKDYLHILSCVGFSRTFSLCAMITYMASASTGFITLVDALSTMQHLFLLFLTIIISIFYPKILKEEINKRTVCFKLVAVVLLILGAAIVSL
jgi:drug/metabolite transporter (DMT)-like permease